MRLGGILPLPSARVCSLNLSRSALILSALAQFLARLLLFLDLEGGIGMKSD